MRSITIRIHCDNCKNTLTEDEAITVKVGNEHETDLCRECATALFARLRRVPSKGSSPMGVYPCTHPGCGKTFTKKGNLNRHVGKIHG